MNTSLLLNSAIGTYVVQSTLHALIAALIVDRSLQAWSIEHPLIRQRFRIAVIQVALFSYPLYQMVNPERGSLLFRLGALFDSARWLSLELWGWLPLGTLFALILVITTLLFLFQELIPILRHARTPAKTSFAWKEYDCESFTGAPLKTALQECPKIFFAETDELFLYSSTGRNTAVYISSGLIAALTPEQLQAALAHEIAHIRRSRRPLLIVVFILRMVLFFNPVVLLEFRRITQEEEKICDDMAAAYSGTPHHMAETLRKIHLAGAPHTDPQGNTLSRVRQSLEEYSHAAHIATRIARLEEETAAEDVSKANGRWPQFICTVIIVAAVNYFIV